MSVTIPTTAELIARNKANIETRLNQTTPPADGAFNTVLAVQQGMAHRGLYALMSDRTAANFALTASGVDLDVIGDEYDCPRNLSKAAEISVDLAADDGTTIGVNSIFVGPQGLQYQVKAAATAPKAAPGSGVALVLVCIDPGSSGNLSAGDELTIQQPVPGAGRIATATALTVIGTEGEGDDDYRVRILDAERAEGGGGNSSDFRTWAQGVPGVKRAYPFSGPAWDSGLTPSPGMRTVYIEAAASVDADGIAPAGLITNVRAALLADADTGAPREILGLTTDLLYVQSIFRTAIYVKVIGLAVTTGTISTAQSAITAALETFLRIFSPFVQGLDPDFEKLDELTASLLSREIQEVLDQFGGTAQSVVFGTTVGVFIAKKTLEDGETLKLGGVTWEEGA